MTLIRLQHIMSNEIAKRAFLSRPPEPPSDVLINDPFGSIFIGTTKIFKMPFSWTYTNLANPHMSIVGITGSGKSYFIKTLLIRASYVWNSNAIIIDWAGEYRDWVKQSGGVVVALAKGDYLNIMDLSSMKPLDRVKQIINAFDLLTDIGQYPEQKRLTEEALEQSYTNFGFIPYEKPPEGKDAPTLKDVIALLDEKLQEGTYEYPAELENAIYRLRQFAREGEDFFARKSTLDLGKLANSGLVDVDVSGLPDERFRALAGLFIVQTVTEKMRAEGWLSVKGLKTILVLDEAWKLAKDDKSAVITIIREGRKYGFALIVASQNPTDINEAIFSNVGTTFMLKVKFENFLNFLQSSLNFSQFIRTEISRFGVGQAAVEMAFQSAIRFPGTFILERIEGEEPLHVYVITLSDILTQGEVSAKIIENEFQFEQGELQNKLIELNMNKIGVDEVFSKLNQSGRKMKILDFVQDLKLNDVSTNNIVLFLKGIGLDDVIITRIISRVGA